MNWFKLIAIGVFIPLFASASSVDEKAKNLKEVEKQISEKREHLNEIVGKEGNLHAELGRLSMRLDDLDQKMDGIRQTISDVNERMRVTESEIESLNGKVRSGQEQIERMVRELYMHGHRSGLEVLLTSESTADLRKNHFLMGRWLQSDAQMLSQFRGSVEMLKAKRKSLEKDMKERESLASEFETNRSEIQERKKDRSQLLAMVVKQKDFYEKSLQELEQAAKDLQALMDKLESQKGEGESLFAKMRGQLPMPAVGTVEKKFGPYIDPKISVKLHHKGIDIRSVEGTPVRAVFDGKVVYAGWFTGYGKIVIVDHSGGYFSLYAHLAEIIKKVDESVSAGDAIAKVGDSDSLKGAYLYFELRYKGISQDPWPWFAESSRLPVTKGKRR